MYLGQVLLAAIILIAIGAALYYSNGPYPLETIGWIILVIGIVVLVIWIILLVFYLTGHPLA